MTFSIAAKVSKKRSNLPADNGNVLKRVSRLRYGNTVNFIVLPVLYIYIIKRAIISTMCVIAVVIHYLFIKLTHM